jgi:hypothetical protein
MVGTPALSPPLLPPLLPPAAPACLEELSLNQIAWTGCLNQVGLGPVGWGWECRVVIRKMEGVHRWSGASVRLSGSRNTAYLDFNES